MTGGRAPLRATRWPKWLWTGIWNWTTEPDHGSPTGTGPRTADHGPRNRTTDHPNWNWTADHGTGPRITRSGTGPRTAECGPGTGAGDGNGPRPTELETGRGSPNWLFLLRRRARSTLSPPRLLALRLSKVTGRRASTSSPSTSCPAFVCSRLTASESMKAARSSRIIAVVDSEPRRDRNRIAFTEDRGASRARRERRRRGSRARS